MASPAGARSCARFPPLASPESPAEGGSGFPATHPNTAASALPRGSSARCYRARWRSAPGWRAASLQWRYGAPDCAGQSAGAREAERSCVHYPPAKVYSKSYECFPSAIVMVIVPVNPTNSPVPESGTTLTICCGAPQQIVSVVPDSGTGELVGLTGTMTITIADGKHSYDFEYTLAGG